MLDDTTGKSLGEIALTVNAGSLDAAPTVTVTEDASGDTLLPYTLPHAEYMYGCLATAVGMVLGYYDLYGYTEDGVTYSFSNIIPGTITVDSRGSDGGSIYDMKDPSVLANFIASTEYVERFYGTTPEQELPYTFVDGKRWGGLNISEWDCLADYLGTGQYWRGNHDLSTAYYYGTLASIANGRFDYTVDGIDIPGSWHDFKYGIALYLGTVGYALADSATASYETLPTSSGSSGIFTFSQFMAEIDAGRPVLISLKSEDGGHMVTAYGYNSARNEIIFDDTYESGCRMSWNGEYYYASKTYSMNAAHTVVLDTTWETPVHSSGSGSSSAVVPSPSGMVRTYNGGVLVSAAKVMTGKELFYGVDGYEDEMRVFSGGLASLTTVSSGGIMYVSYGGWASSTTVASNGSMYLSCGTATRTTVDLGTMIVSGYGAVANSTTVYGDFGWIHRGDLYVLRGGVTSDTVIRSGARMCVDSRGTASATVVSSGGVMIVSKSGKACGVVVSSGGSLTLDHAVSGYNYGYEVCTIIGGEQIYGGRVNVQAPVQAEETTKITFAVNQRKVADPAIVVNLDYIRGGEYFITVGASQELGVYRLASGATAFDRTVTVKNTSGTTFGTLTVGNSLKYGERLYELAVSGDNLNLLVLGAGSPAGQAVRTFKNGVLVSSANIMTGKVLRNGGSEDRMVVYYGGTANLTVVNSGGSMQLGDGGEKEKENDGYYATYIYCDAISGGGIASATKINADGRMDIWNGQADDTGIYSGGGMYVHFGRADNTTVNSGGSMTVHDGNASYTDVLRGGSMIVGSGRFWYEYSISTDVVWFSVADTEGTVAFTNVSGGDLTVWTGRAADTVIRDDGTMYVYSGTAERTVISGGELHLYGGSALNTTISGGAMTVDGGGGFGDGYLACYGAVASNTVVRSGGRMDVRNDGHAVNVTVDGRLTLSTTSSFSYDYYYYGYQVSDIVTYCPGSASLVAVNHGGEMYVGDNGYADIVTVNSGGMMRVGSRTTLSGRHTYGGTVMLDDVANEYYSNLDVVFAVNQRTASGDIIVNNLAYLNAETFAVRVSDAQSDGVYKLAGGAAEFDDTVTVRNTDGATLGELSVGGELTSDQYTYTLGRSGEILYFTVTGGGMRPPVSAVLYRGAVETYRTGDLASAAKVMTGKTLAFGGTEDTMRVFSGGTANSTVVNDRGFMFVSSGGTANSTVVDQGGSMYISNGGTAKNTAVSGGDLNVCSGGQANSATVNSGGALNVYFGGMASNTVVNSDGHLFISSGAVLRGDLILGGSASLLGAADAAGADVTFAVDQRSTEDDYIVNDLAYLDARSFTVTVKTDQAAGTYKLASGAAAFNKTVSVKTATGSALGTLTVGGSFANGGYTYGLAVDGGILNFTVTAGTLPPPTDGKVRTYKNDILVSAADVMTEKLLTFGGTENIMHISDGGVANSTTVLTGCDVHVSGGGLANDTAVSSGGCLYVSSGGVVSKTKVYGNLIIQPTGIIVGKTPDPKTTRLGGLSVLSGGTAILTDVSLLGHMDVYGSASATTDLGTVDIYSGGVMSETTVRGGILSVSDGGTAESTTVSGGGLVAGGRMHVCSGGTASDTIVSSGGTMYASGGAILRGYLTLGGSASMLGAAEAANADVTFAVDQRSTEDGYIVDNLAYLDAKSFSVTVGTDQTEGTYQLASGAASFNRTVTVKTTTGGNLGTLTVGGLLTSGNYTYSLGRSGEILNFTVAPGTSPAPTGEAVKTYKTNLLVSAADVMTGKVLVYGGAENVMRISNGGVAKTTTVSSGGYIYIYNGGAASGTVVRSAGYVHVSNGGLASGTVVSNFGNLRVSQGGNASDSIVSNGGYARIYNGGLASGTVVSNGGRLFVSSGGAASGTFILTGGELNVSNGGAARGTFISAGGYARIETDGAASDTAVSSGGEFLIDNGGTMRNAVVSSGGKLYAVGGATLTGKLTIGGYAMLTGAVNAADAEVTFAVDQHGVHEAGFVDNIEYLNTTKLNITVRADQEVGLYDIAYNAADFDRTITVKNTTGSTLGTLAVGGSLTSGGYTYELDTNDRALTLLISQDFSSPTITVTADVTAPTTGNVTLTANYSGDSVTKQYRVGSIGDWINYTSPVVMTGNGTAYFRAVDAAGNEGFAEYTVSNIDRDAPTITVTADVTAPTTGNVTLTANYSGDSVTKQYRVGSIGDWINYTSPVVMTVNGTAYFRAVDAAGNEALVEYTVSNIIDDDNTWSFFGEVGYEVFQESWTPNLDYPGWYSLTGNFGSLNGTITIFNGTKTVANGSIKDGVLNFNKGKNFLLDSALEYTIVVKNTDRGKSASAYELVLRAEHLFTRIDHTDDWTNLKTAGAGGDVADLGVLTPNFSVSDWAGFGDEFDYKAFTIESAAQLTVSVTAADAVKFTVNRLVEEKNGTFSLKPAQTINVKAGATGTVKNLLLEKGTYYLGVQSTNAAKGGDANYTITLDGTSIFFTKGDNSDDWTDLKTAGAASELIGNVGTLTAPGVVTEGWVGFGDEFDYKAFTIESAARLVWSFGASDATKFTVNKLEGKTDKKGVTTYSLKAYMPTTVKAGASVTTKELLLDKGTYYIGIQSTNAGKSGSNAKGGNSDYTVALNTASEFFTRGNNSDDLWDAAPTLKSGAVLEDWVGFGDKIDYRMLTTDAAGGFYSFNLSGAANNVKLTVYRVESKTDKNGVTTYSLKSVKSVTATAKTPAISTGDLCFAADTRYVVAVEAPDAAKAKNSDYTLSMTEKATFVNRGNETWETATAPTGDFDGILTAAAGGDKFDYYDLSGIGALEIGMLSGKVKVSFHGENKKEARTEVICANGEMKEPSAMTLETGNASTGGITLAALDDSIRYLKIEAATNGINSYRLSLIA